jgi:putative transcriptional regulator
METSPEYVWGFITGLAIVVAAAVLVFYAMKKRNCETRYDERQQVIRSRAYRAAFWTLAAYLALSGLFSTATGLEWADAMTGSFIGICIAVTVFVVISISGDAYFGIHEKPGFYLPLFAILIVVNAGMGIINLLDGEAFVTDGRLNFHCTSFIIVAVFLAIFIALAVKAISRRRRDEMKNLRLKAARAACDISQQELADRVGVSRQTINAIEKGDYNPTIRLCIAICRALGKTLNELFWVTAAEEEE